MLYQPSLLPTVDMYFAPSVIYSHAPGLWLGEVSLYSGALGIWTLVSGDEPASCLWTYSQCCHHCPFVSRRWPHIVELGGFEPPSCPDYYCNFLYPQLTWNICLTSISFKDFCSCPSRYNTKLNDGRNLIRVALLYTLTSKRKLLDRKGQRNS